MLLLAELKPSGLSYNEFEDDKFAPPSDTHPTRNPITNIVRTWGLYMTDSQ